MGETKRRRRRKRCGDGNGNGDGDGDGDLLLPEDVLIQIMLSLPVISLLRFKSVCKSWGELIDSSFFIDLHTSTTFNFSSSSSSKFGASILQITGPSYHQCPPSVKLFILSSGSSDDHGDGDDDYGYGYGECDNDGWFKVDKDLGFLPFYRDYLLEDTLYMVGSCNGIICLYDPEAMDISRGSSQQHYSNLRDTSLYNPATRQFRILPKSIPIDEKKQYYMGYWLENFISFGYDVKTKDYKVLRITLFIPRNASAAAAAMGEEEEEEEEEGCMCRVQVYSLSTDSWRLLEGINSLPVQVLPRQNRYEHHGIYLHGSYFFVGRKPFTDGKGDDDFMLLSFDFTKEIFTPMQLPDNYSRYNQMVLSSLGGGEMALSHGCHKYYDISVLNEQHGSSSGLGVLNKEESWTKLKNSNLLFRMKEEQNNNEPMKGKPRCISNNGEFALISTCENKLQLFNLVTKEAINFTIERTADVYKESLVSIMGGNVLLKWQLPTHGTTYKLNLDAPFIHSNYTFGIGLCLTSDTTGGCIGVRSLGRRCVRDEEEGEALAMLEAIKWAKELGLSHIIIESDSENCVSFFIDDDDDDDSSTYWSSEALSLLEEAKLLLKNSSELSRSISFQYCSRSCNYVADIAAKLGRERWTSDNMDWTAKFPGEMVKSLSEDFVSKIW